MSAFHPFRPLQPHFLIGISSVELPAFDHVDDVIEWLIGMRRSANEPVRVRTITNHDPIDEVFNPGRSWSDDCYERDLIPKALFNETIE